MSLLANTLCLIAGHRLVPGTSSTHHCCRCHGDFGLPITPQTIPMPPCLPPRQQPASDASRPLALASTDDLCDELRRRHPCLLVISVTGTQGQIIAIRSRATVIELLGLAALGSDYAQTLGRSAPRHDGPIDVG